MMEMVLIRHGEPDTAACDSRNFAGQGYELAPLTQKGVAQAKEAAHSPLLQGAQMILSSPYTRALQTAAEISRVAGLEIRVEMDLRELEKDLQHRSFSKAQLDQQHQEFLLHKGSYPQNQPCCWETVEQLSQRVLPVLEQYTSYKKIIVVTHGGVIRRFVEKGKIEYAKPYLVQVSSPIKCFGWCE